MGHVIHTRERVPTDPKEIISIHIGIIFHKYIINYLAPIEGRFRIK